jgi:hypothetical protein
MEILGYSHVGLLMPTTHSKDINFGSELNWAQIPIRKVENCLESLFFSIFPLQPQGPFVPLVLCPLIPSTLLLVLDNLTLKIS